MQCINNILAVIKKRHHLFTTTFGVKFDVAFNRQSALRDWSLITGRGGGGYKTGGGGHVKFYPYEKGGAGKVLAILKGGHKKFWGSFYVVA